jgi:hypothetical protein
MQLFCPTCESNFPAASRCPRCDGRLVTPAETTAPAEKPVALPDPVRPTLAGRLTVGCLVGLGLAVALREWTVAGLQVIGMGDFWDSPEGGAVAVTLRMAGAVVAGLLAGAGRVKGQGAGLVVGLTLGWLFAMGDAATGTKPGLFTAVSAVGLGVVGAAAGAIGGHVWPAAVHLPPPPAAPGSSWLNGLVDKQKKDGPRRPPAWGQLAVGVMVCVSSVLVADSVRDLFRKTGNTTATLGGAAYIPTLDVSLAAFGVVIGGIVAAVGTGSGFRNGLACGGVAGIAVTGLAAAGVKATHPILEGLLKLAGLPTRNLAAAEPMMLLAFGVMVVAAAGGWLGGALFPPVVAAKPKGRNVD